MAKLLSKDILTEVTEPCVPRKKGRVRPTLLKQQDIALSFCCAACCPGRAALINRSYTLAASLKFRPWKNHLEMS